MLNIRWPGGDREFSDAAVVRIGRDPASDVEITDERVSRIHAEVRPAADGWLFVDQGSSGGSYVGGQRAVEVLVRTPMTIRLGHPVSGVEIRLEPVAGRTAAGSPTITPTEVPLERGQVATIAPPPSPLARPGGVLASEAAVGATQVVGDTLQLQVAGTTRTLAPGETVTIGRDGGCDVVSSNPTVSRTHARIAHDGQRWVLRDLGSTRGTFLDGERVSEQALQGSMAFWLGAIEAGERVVTVAAGDHRSSMSSKARRFGVPGILAVAALVVALVAGGWVLFGRDGSDDVDVAALRSATVHLVAGQAGGSGSIIDGARGLILTNAHVVQPDAPGLGVGSSVRADDLREPEPDILVELSMGPDEPAEPAYIGEVVAADGYLDLAVVRITETIGGRPVGDDEDLQLPFIELGDSMALDQDNELIIFGYPSVAGTNSSTRTDGSVGGFVPDARLDDQRAWINTSASIAGGNSGGLAADETGHLVGVPTQEMYRDDGPADSISQLRPIHLALPLIEAARAGEPYTSPFVEPARNEEFGEPRFAFPGDAPFDLSCRDADADGLTSADVVAVAIDYLGFPDGHQDVMIEVFLDGEWAGRATSADQWPVRWGREGCVVMSVPLAASIEPGQEVGIRIDAGPNYERELGAYSFTAT